MTLTLRDYQDPLDVIWIETARRLEIEIRRDAEVFAAWDGERVLTLGTPETLDPDDSLAQLIFHELCHALVEGPSRFHLPDWGLENRDTRDELHELACLRLQAALADRYGLRRFLAATTDYRPHYAELPPFPLGDQTHPAVVLALPGWERATAGPWAQPLAAALQATATILQVTRPFAPSNSLWRS
jgi:hypothetical protein